MMGLLDKAKAETEKYIEVDLFLYYLAFSQNETLDNVLTWLRNNYFENDITSYEIDENYRIEPNLENPNIDNQTALLMDMLQIDGLFNYFMYLSHYQDGLDFEQYFYDGYKPVHTNFYYEINDLNKLKYIKELGIDFYNAKKYSFTINSHDEVKAELRLDSRLEKLITFTSKTIDTENPFSPTQEPQKYHILETLRHSQKNEISHDLSNNSELVQQVANLTKANLKNRNPNKPPPKSHELVGRSAINNHQVSNSELVQQQQATIESQAKEIAELKNNYDELKAHLNEWREDSFIFENKLKYIRELEKENKSLREQLEQTDKPSQSDTPAGNDPFNWQSMSINVYPPELHLAMTIWQEYYDPNLNDNSQFVTAKFNRIATNLGLINGDLKKRIRTILTSAPSKKKSQILANNLKNINILNLGDFFIDDN